MVRALKNELTKNKPKDVKDQTLSSGHLGNKYTMLKVNMRLFSSISWFKRLRQKLRFHEIKEVKLRIEKALESLSFTSLLRFGS